LFKLAHPLTPSPQSWAPTIEKQSDKRQLTQTIQQTAVDTRQPGINNGSNNNKKAVEKSLLSYLFCSLRKIENNFLFEEVQKI
jgi:hypothetical protein